MESSSEEHDLPPSPSARPLAKAPSARTAKQVIDQAIKENWVNEYLLYSFATLFVLAGLALLGTATWRGDPWTGLVGVVASALFVPAMQQARQIRRENIAIRLLEYPLSKATNEREASEALKDFFVDTFIKRPANPGQ